MGSPLAAFIEPKDALSNASSIYPETLLNLFNKIVESSFSGSASLVCILCDSISGKDFTGPALNNPPGFPSFSKRKKSGLCP
jgi:hypothetical protein